MSGELMVFNSKVSIHSKDAEEIAYFHTEFLNTLSVSGLQDMDSRKRLCNGTRLFIRGLSENVIFATIATGNHKGTNVFFPLIVMSPTERDLPFELIRRQFPILPAFAIAINKSQGQSFERVGVYGVKNVISFLLHLSLSLSLLCFIFSHLVMSFSLADDFSLHFSLSLKLGS